MHAPRQGGVHRRKTYHLTVVLDWFSRRVLA
jgi:hypothetical protein